jgi:hypothetical protein
MTRYFFDTLEDDTLDRDTEGVELPDDAAARNQAKAALTEMAREKLPNGNHMNLHVQVRHEAGHEIYRASLTLDGRNPD